jgi:hypothetical protein
MRERAPVGERRKEVALPPSEAREQLRREIAQMNIQFDEDA